MVNLLHYDTLAEFKRQYFKDLLTVEHLIGGQVKIDKLSFTDGSTDDNANFWGYILEKGGKKYLLSAKDKEGNEIDIRKTLPIVAKNTMKVANKGIVYHWIKSPVTAKFKSVMSLPFKKFVDELASFDHSNPEHYKLMWFIVLTCMFDRANFRISTPAGFGKDSTIDIVGNLVGGAATIENPTLAKLEFMTTNKLLAVNEVVDASSEDWRNMQQFLLSTGAHKPEVTKHSRASTGTKEYLDVSELSILLMYNDIDCYPDVNKYFDVVTKKAVKDRFPSFRFYGHFLADFNKIKNISISKFVQDNMNKYKDIIYNFTYYKENYRALVKGFKVNGFETLPERWKTNIMRLLRIIDLYCETQEEFDYWVKIIDSSLKDYNDMGNYMDYIERVRKFQDESSFKKTVEELKLLPTFTARNERMKSILTGEKEIKDVSLGIFV